MILFPNLALNGRLGNQMFQLATMLALSFESGSPLKLPSNIYNRITHGQQSLLKYLNHDLECMTSTEENYYNNLCDVNIQFPEENDTNWKRSEFINTQFNIIQLNGWPESELFFIKYKDQIKNRLSLNDEIQKIGNSYIYTLKEKIHSQIEVVGIHIRRGDITIGINEAEWSHIVESCKNVKDTYFNDKQYIFLFFTGGNHSNDNTEDIKWVRNNFNEENCYICDHNDTLLDFSTMIACDHMILMNRSTLGWWAGYLNTNKNKKIIVPKKTYPPIRVTPDIFWAEEFIQIDMYNL